MKRQIRALKVASQDLARGDIGQVSRVFDKVVASPEYSKMLRGCIMFSFGQFDNDPRHGFEIDQVRRYTRLIDDKYPFFAYFLPQERSYNQILPWLVSLASTVDTEPGTAGSITVDPGEFVKLVVARIMAVQSFCDRIQDDPDEIIEAILDAVPEEISAAARVEMKM